MEGAKDTVGMRDRYKGQMFVPGAWRSPFFVIGGIGLVWVVLWLVSMRHRDFDVLSTSKTPGNGVTLGQVVRDRRFIILLAVGMCINIPWQLIRAWLPKILQEGRGYSEQAALLFNSAYYIATDVGCLIAGAATLWLVKRTGCTVHQSRVRVFGACAMLIALTTVAAQLPKGWPLLAVLLVIGAASLGVFPCAYSFKQDLAREHMGKITGLIGAGAWVAASPCPLLSDGW